MTRLRLRVSERLKGAQNTYAMLTTFNEIDMTGLMELRNKYKDAFLEVGGLGTEGLVGWGGPPRLRAPGLAAAASLTAMRAPSVPLPPQKAHGCKLGFMSAFVKAAAVALQEVPAVNAVIDGAPGRIRVGWGGGQELGSRRLAPRLRAWWRQAAAALQRSPRRGAPPGRTLGLYFTPLTTLDSSPPGTVVVYRDYVDVSIPPSNPTPPTPTPHPPNPSPPRHRHRVPRLRGHLHRRCDAQGPRGAGAAQRRRAGLCRGGAGESLARGGVVVWRGLGVRVETGGGRGRGGPRGGAAEGKWQRPAKP
jgi:hypothetical protein